MLTAALLVLVLSFHSPEFGMSAPIDGPSEPPFVPDPTGRGTIGLVTSCLFTLSLCVWTAIHLNIYPAKTPKSTCLLHKAGWAVLAMFAPELVLWRAISQWQCARKIRDKCNQYSRGAEMSQRQENTQEGDLENNDATKWRLEHGFFVAMGGLEVTVKDEDSWILNDGRTVTPAGVIQLAKLNLLPTLNLETIQGRSKADTFAKTLVCLQAGWMILQCISRKASGLPITLLELNTLAHVGCAVIMYAVWWKKPQNVTETFPIQIDRHVATYMSNSSLRGDFQESDGFTQVFELEEARGDDGMITLYSRQSLAGIPFTLGVRMRKLTDDDIKRLKLMADPSSLVLHPPYGEELTFYQSRRLSPKASNMSIIGNIKTESLSETLVLFAALGMLYGGIHAASWNGHFPSPLERTMWRIAACSVAGGGFIIWPLYALSNMIARSRNYLGMFTRDASAIVAPAAVARAPVEPLSLALDHLDAFKTERSKKATQLRAVVWCRYCILGVIYTFGLTVCASRVFLVVEAFISLRSLPLGAYSSPNWVNLLPHIG